MQVLENDFFQLLWYKNVKTAGSPKKITGSYVRTHDLAATEQSS